MPVDPGIAALLDLMNSADLPSFAEVGPEVARAGFKAMRTDGELPPVRSSVDRSVPGPAGEVPLRIVHPDTDDLAGVLVWMHGGGWVIGDLDTAETTQRRLATAAGCVVVSVDYRLAPEHPAPAGIDDTWAALTWVADHLDELGVPGARIAVGGDSAGGNLAALATVRAAAEGGPALAHQLLVYPCTDLTMTNPSITENGEGLFLTADTMRWFVDCNLGGGFAADDPTVSPLFADPKLLAAAPAAHIVVADFDPLRDEGIAYAERLAALGVEVDLARYPTMVHGFFAMAQVTPVADEALARAAAALRTSLRD